MTTIKRRIADLEARAAARTGRGPINFATLEFYSDDSPVEIEQMRQAAQDQADGYGLRSGQRFNMVEVIKARQAAASV